MSKIYLNNGVIDYTVINAGTPALRTGAATVTVSAGTCITRANGTTTRLNAGTPQARAQADTTTRRAVDALMTGRIREALTSEYTIAATLYGDDVSFCRPATVVEYAGQYFNVIGRYKYRDGLMPMCDITAEHVSYQLNNEVYNVSTFSMTGTATELLTAALNGTPFSVGTVDATGEFTLVLNEACSRRALLIAIANKVGGELTFTGYNVNIANHIGSVPYVELLETDNVIDVAENTDEREGTRSFTITLGRKTTLALGDNIHLVFTPLDIDAHTRITAIEYNPYNTHEVTIEVGDYEPDIVDTYASLGGKVAEYHQEFTVANGVFTTAISDLNDNLSAITQTAGNITARVEAAEESITALELTSAQFAATVERIGSGGAITAASIIAAINGVESSITLSADKININGVVSANGNFTVGLDGTITAVNGTFSGTINATSGTFSGVVNASSGVIGSGATYKWTIGNSTTNASIYCGLAAIPGVPFGSTSNYAYIGTNGIGLITESSAMGESNFNYGTVIRSGSAVVYGDPNGQGLMNRGIQFSPDGISFWFGGNKRIDESTISDLTEVGSLAIRNGYTADDAPLQLMYAELLYCKRVWADGDGIYNIGTAGHKFNDIYAVNSVIQTSDKKKKHDIEPVPDKYSVFFDALSPIVYKLTDGTSGRTHAGLGAQDIITALSTAGLTTKDFAGVCISDIVAADGTVTQEYGIRYAEFISICISEIQKLKKAVAALQKGNGNGNKKEGKNK